MNRKHAPSATAWPDEHHDLSLEMLNDLQKKGVTADVYNEKLMSNAESCQPAKIGVTMSLTDSP